MNLSCATIYTCEQVGATQYAIKSLHLTQRLRTSSSMFQASFPELTINIYSSLKALFLLLVTFSLRAISLLDAQYVSATLTLQADPAQYTLLSNLARTLPRAFPTHSP